MKISLTTEYGIHALIFLANQPREEYTLLEDIANAYPFSRSYLQKVCQTLARKGILIAHRGVKGGYILAREPEDLTLREIVEVLEDTSGLYRCLAYKRKCNLQDDCAIANVFRQIEETMYRSLEQTTLANLVHSTNKKASVKFPVTAGSSKS
jgi:Rrf2 family protein